MNANLVALAKDLTRAKPNELPEKLLQLERRSSAFLHLPQFCCLLLVELLQRTTSKTTMKYDIIALDILPMLLLTLRQDFTNLMDGWRLAATNLSPLARSVGDRG